MNIKLNENGAYYIVREEIKTEHRTTVKKESNTDSHLDFSKYMKGKCDRVYNSRKV